MKQLKTEVIQMPNLANSGNWTELFNALFPKVSGVDMQDFVKLEVTASNITITRLVEA